MNFKCQVFYSVQSIDVLNKLTFVQHTGGQPLKCRNYQEIKLQEQVQRLAMGTIPRSLWVVLEDDLVDVCKAGDDVIVWFVACFTNLIVFSNN